MKVGDLVDELLVHVSDPRSEVRMGAILALNALWEHHAPDCIGAGEPAGRQIPDEAIGRVRESLLAAIAALDAARLKNPGEPMGLLS
jgi:hypothetical protein